MVHSIDCCVCLLPFIFLKLKTFCNLLPFTLSNKNRQSDLFFPPANKAATEWFPKQMGSLWAKSFTPTTWHSMYYLVPCFNTRPQPTQLTRQVDCHRPYFNFFWVNPHHCTQSYFPPWCLSWSHSLKNQPFGRVIFLLLLQYSNITPNWSHQSLQSRRCCLLPPQPPQVTVLPASLPLELVELLVAASPGLIERFIIMLWWHERSVSWRLLMNMHGQFFKRIFH